MLNSPFRFCFGSIYTGDKGLHAKVRHSGCCAAQGKVGDIINDLFDIKSEYLGSFATNFAKVCHWFGSFAFGVVNLCCKILFVTHVFLYIALPLYIL